MNRAYESDIAGGSEPSCRRMSKPGVGLTELRSYHLEDATNFYSQILQSELVKPEHDAPKVAEVVLIVG